MKATATKFFGSLCDCPKDVPDGALLTCGPIPGGKGFAVNHIEAHALQPAETVWSSETQYSLDA